MIWQRWKGFTEGSVKKAVLEEKGVPSGDEFMIFLAISNQMDAGRCIP